MDREEGQPSDTSSHVPTASPSTSGVPASFDLGFQCVTWEEVQHILLLWQVPATQLPYWEACWRWDQLKALVASQEVDVTTLRQRSMEFLLRIEGTREDYECLVPERERRMGSLCEKRICRQDRALSHLYSKHLGVREFQCEGQCGKGDCKELFLQKRYLKEHIDPVKDSCPQCGKVMYKRNMGTHRC